jgi:hypothetical protein
MLRRANHITIANNLLDDISGLKWGYSHRGVGFAMAAPDYLTISHNTIQFAEKITDAGVTVDNDAGWWLNVPFGPPVGMTVDSNVFGWQIFGDGAWGPDATRGAVFTNNNLYNLLPQPDQLGGWQASTYSVHGNTFNVAAPAGVGANTVSLLGGEAAIKAGHR